jgi:hypothetical protein
VELLLGLDGISESLVAMTTLSSRPRIRQPARPSRSILHQGAHPLNLIPSRASVDGQFLPSVQPRSSARLEHLWRCAVAVFVLASIVSAARGGPVTVGAFLQSRATQAVELDNASRGIARSRAGDQELREARFRTVHRAAYSRAQRSSEVTPASCPICQTRVLKQSAVSDPASPGAGRVGGFGASGSRVQNSRKFVVAKRQPTN